ncbi:MAG: chitobiase/beta-hexosaminidase C-terminal domain-containing protein [Opitutaceae bacterium]|nr:chitobiase/beta-hexosaminidase C-terminal domain-containing protein [Opitutaceae bacterium]
MPSLFACRRMLLTATALVATALTGSAWNSEKVVVDPVTGKLSYPADSEGNRIPDYSNAGYRGADHDIPQVDRIVGTIPAGSTLAQINAIIAAANVSPAQPGVLLMEAGTYTIDGTISVNKPGLVLRGAGDGRDGGPATIIKQTNMVWQTVVIDVNGGAADSFRTKVAGTETEITTQRVQVGSRSFQVANAGAFQVGDNIIINHPCTQRWEDTVDPQNLWDVDPSHTQKDINLGAIRYHRYITAISGNTITVDAPVFNHLDRALSISTIYKYGRTSTIKEVGIENLQVQGAPRTINTDTGKNGTDDAIRFRAAENCWIRGVSVKFAARAGIVFTGASTRCTAYDCRVTDPAGAEVGGNWYGFAVQEAQLILFNKCYSAGQRHAFITNGTVYDSGIVVLNSILASPRGSAEMHRLWGQGMLFDGCVVTQPKGVSISLTNRGKAGSNHGWAAAHGVIWRCDGGGKPFTVQKPVTAQNYAIGNFNCVTVNNAGLGAGPLGYVEGTGRAGLEPQSLYLAQLRQRNGRTPDFTLTTTPASRTVVAGAAATYTATINAVDGFNGTVNFAASGLPANTTASFSPATVTTSGTTTLTLATSAGTPVGSHPFTLTASSGPLVRTKSATLVVQEIVAAPTFSIASGTYPAAQDVRLATTTTDARIHYTTNNTDPSETTGTLYNGTPIRISANTTLKAVAFKTGQITSSVSSATYVINPPTPTQLVYEAENTNPVASGTNTSVAVLTDTAASAGKHIVLRADGTGDAIEYSLNNVPAGTYELRLRYRAVNNRGTLALRVDGTVRGTNLNQYAASASYKEQSFGLVTFATTGNHKIKLTVVSKSTSSSAYDLGADAFILVRQP